MSASLAQRLADVDEAIAQAARDAGRHPDSVTRIVVTKFHPVSLVRDLFALGVREFGENRQQELSEKIEHTRDLPEKRWHFIGQAQTNKARAIRQAADVVHSVDRIRLSRALDDAAEEGEAPLDVLVQINLTDDPARGGVRPDQWQPLVEDILNRSSLALRGVMAVAPLDEDPASAFARLRDVADAVRRVAPGASWLSAGMTGDFREAITAGATHLRIGSAITGLRPPAS